MLGWLAGRYYVKEARKCATVAAAMPYDHRRHVVSRITDEMGRFFDKEPHGQAAAAAQLRSALQHAARERQMAVAAGARSYADPTWLAPALVETWTGACLGYMQGRISKRAFSKVDSTIAELIRETIQREQAASRDDLRR